MIFPSCEKKLVVYEKMKIRAINIREYSLYCIVLNLFDISLSIDYFLKIRNIHWVLDSLDVTSNGK